MKTVVELPTFERGVRGRLSKEELQELISFIAQHPQAGDIIEGSGGARKLRWGASGRGKAGGARVISYFHCEGCPIYLLTIYLKSERANLSKAELETLKTICKELADDH